MMGLTHWKSPRCWERLTAEGEEGSRGRDGITDAVDMNLGRLQQMARDREAWCVAVHGIAELDWATEQQQHAQRVQSQPTLCGPMDYRPPDSSIQGTFQTPLSMEFSRQHYWSRLSFPTPEGRPDPGIKPMSPASPARAGGFFTTVTSGLPSRC